MRNVLSAFVCLSVLLTVSIVVGEAAEPAIELTPGDLEVRKHLRVETFDVTTLRLWPDAAPDDSRSFPEEAVLEGRRTPRITNVTRPSITIAHPKQLTGPTPAVIVCPGGGYGGLGITDGGVDIINWLRPLGVTGVYMKYRVPKRGRGFEQHHQALQDIQRATSLLRSQAKELGIDPQRIGAIGFSAGGHLVAMLATNHADEHRLYQPIDDVDRISCRPDFVAMVAPAYLTKPILSAQLDPALHAGELSRHTVPPVFITSAVTDKFTVGALHFYLLLREKHVLAETHIYEKGGHAEGIRSDPDNQWPPMFADWLRRKEVIASGSPETHEAEN